MTTDEKREWVVQHLHSERLAALNVSIETLRDYFRQKSSDLIEVLFMYYLKQSMKE